MKSTKKAFTLVELIVVITILAILGTIAFISLGSYTGDARNAKRTDGISKIATSIENALIDGKTATSFAADATSELSNISIAGAATADIGATDYEAGPANYTALNIKAEDFVDPNSDSPYVVGATSGNNYEVAAKLEDDAGDTARVMGNWSPRVVGVPGTVNGTFDAANDTFELTSGGDINKLRKGDTVTNGASTLEVLKVSRDGETLTMSGTVVAWAGTLVLSAAESAGLIADATTDTNPVIDGSTTALPY